MSLKLNTVALGSRTAVKVVVALVFAASLGAWAQVPGKAAKTPADKALIAQGAKLYTERTCVACHGKDAKTPILPTYPRLAGQSAPYAEQQMRDIKSGARSNANTAAMKGIMPLVPDEEIPALAAYLQSLK